ncbi:hypothetical protein ACXR0M_18825 [Pseudomonas sp. Eth.TT006]
MNTLIKSMIALALTTGLMQNSAFAAENGTTNVYRCQQYSDDFKNYIWKFKRFYHEAPTAEEFMNTDSAKTLGLKNCKVWLDKDNATHWEW